MLKRITPKKAIFSVKDVFRDKFHANHLIYAKNGKKQL